MLASFAFGACAEDDAGVGARRASLAEGCLLNTDCTAPLACAFRKCHLECTSSRDCEPGQLCVPSEKPFYVCQLPTEVKCRYNSQCAGSQVCGVDGKCRQECVSERDCLPEQKCTQATCAEAAELSAGKLPVVSTVSGAAGAPSGGSCRYAEDCPPTLSCRAGQCMAECLGDRDCVSPKACTAGRCALPLPPDGSTPPAGYGNGCNLNSDCGEVLVCGKAGLCVYACNTAADCASECCQAHSCAAPSACGLVGGGGDAGTSGSGGAGGGGAGSGGGGKGGGVGKGGNAGQSGGGGAPSNPCDADDDGYIAAGGDCGGDDCDDGSAKIHPMAKERCDGLDNDCDGEIDENAWTTQGAFVVPHDAGGKLVDRVNGPPGLAVLPGNPPRIFLSYSDIPEGKEGRVLLQELDEKLVAKGALSVLEPELGGLKTTLATDGTTLAIAVSTYFGGTGKSSVRATTFAPDVPPTSLPIISPEGGRETRPALVWTGSRFAMFWSDTSVATRRLYRSSASAGGAFASPLLVYSDAAKVADSYIWWPAVAAGAGDGTVAAYARISGKGAFVLFPDDLSSPLFDNADTGGDVWPGAVGKVGADWIGLGSVGSTNTILQLDGKTAKLSASRSLSLDASGTFGDVLPLSPQTALVAWNAYQSVKWALVPLGLGTNGETDPLKQAPLGIGELESTTAVSAPALARIDDTHIALVWQDTELRAALLECTP